jgi:hypothetical protein
MVNAPLCAEHVANLILSSIHGKDWHQREKDAIRAREIPEQYVISEERINSATDLPEVRERSARGGAARAVGQMDGVWKIKSEL